MDRTAHNPRQRKRKPVLRGKSKRKKQPDIGRKRRRSRFPRRTATRRRRTILVIDHAVPLYDKDTGSRNTFQFLRLFLKMGFRVKFVGADYVRHEPYTTELERMGVQVLSAKYKRPRSLLAWLRRNGKTIDYAYLIRPNVADAYIGAVRKYTKAKIVYNGVDFHYVREMRRYELEQNPDILAHARRLKEQEFRIFSQSDVVYTVSEYEKAILDEETPGKKVVVIPTFFYEQPFPLGGNAGYGERSDILFVGGFAHPPNVDGMLWFVGEVLPVVRGAIPDIRLHILGSNPPKEIVDLSGDRIHVTGYIPDEELESYYSSSRVVVAPIRYGAGVKGKIIEAIAHGVPVVTTSIGAEGIPDASRVLATAEDPESFAVELIEAYQNEMRWEDARNREIEYACRYLSEQYALSILGQDFREPIRRAFRRRRAAG